MLNKKVVREKLKKVIDPELGINIVDLGLVYDVKVTKKGKVLILMTLTTPGCPLAGVFEDLVIGAVKEIKEVAEVSVRLTFDPPWTEEMMSEDARLELGI